LGGENVSTLNKKESQGLIEKLENSRNNIQEHLANVKIKAIELSGYAIPLRENKPIFCGRYQRNGYCIEMYVLSGEGDYIIPLLLFIPNGNEKFPAVIYIHPEGKIAEASTGGEIEKIVKKGFIVAAPDLLGIGETKTDSTLIRPSVHLFKDAMIGILIGRSVVGIQAGDVVRVANFLKTRDNVNKEKIGAIATGDMCLPLLHAAAFDESIKSIGLLGSIISYRSVVMNESYKFDIVRNRLGNFYESDYSSIVAGALTAYDLPDLIGCVAPRKVLLAGLKNQMLEPATNELIEQELKFPRSVFSFKNVSENINVLPSYDNIGTIIDWCFK
jgi:hypothetical protein